MLQRSQTVPKSPQFNFTRCLWIDIKWGLTLGPVENVLGGRQMIAVAVEMIKTKTPVLFKSFKTKQARVFYSRQKRKEKKKKRKRRRKPASGVLFAPQAPVSVTQPGAGGA